MYAAHAGQIDKAGQPYYLHPLAVSEMCVSPTAKIIALLHDVIEDTAITVSDISDRFGPEIARYVDAVTHRTGEGYFDYIRRVKSDPIAAEVKIADLRHNLNLTRLPRIGLDDVLRAEKYIAALKLLLETA